MGGDYCGFNIAGFHCRYYFEAILRGIVVSGGYTIDEGYSGIAL